MNASQWVAAGLGDFGLLLCLAAVAKLASPAEFATAVTRVLPRPWWVDHPRLVAQSARITALAEVLMAPIVVFGGVPGAALATVLAILFVTVVWRALKRGASCGCWGSFSPSQTGGAELVRATALAVICATVFAVMLNGVRPTLEPPAVGAAALILVALVAISHLGASLRRSKPKVETPARDIRGVVAWLVLAAPTSVRNSLPERPLWPWQNLRTLRRWQATSLVADELARVDAEITELSWHDAVVRQIGAERRALIVGSRVHLLVSETKGPTGPIYQCWAIAFPRTPASPSGKT